MIQEVIKAMFHRDLAAARSGAVDPTDVVGHWEMELSGLLDIRDSGGPLFCQEVYDLLAIRHKLRRCSPSLLRGSTKLDLERLDIILRQQEEKWIPAALSVMNPEGWLQEAQRLDRMMEAADTSHEEYIKLAIRLVEDLDDAYLVFTEALLRGARDQKLEDGLVKCVHFLSDKPEPFTTASCWIQSVCRTIRLDLPTFDQSLFLAAMVFVVLLDTIEDIEYADLENVKPMSAEQLEKLLAKYLKWKESQQ